MRVMLKKAAVLVSFLAASAVQTATAAPPFIRPIDIPTTYGFCEGARHVARQSMEQRVPADPFAVRTIVLDPGHGGEGDGAVGVANVPEKHLTLDLAYAVRDALEARHPNVRVVLTRYWDRDVDLYERVRWANSIGAELFISLHYNAATHDRAVGYETYFLSDDVIATTSETGSRWKQQGSKVQKRARRKLDAARVAAHGAARQPLIEPHLRSKRVAALVQQELAARLETPNRGVKQADFAVLRGALMPAVVVESGFLTHPEEGVEVLTSAHRASVVEALVTAIETYERELRPDEPEPEHLADSSN